MRASMHVYVRGCQAFFEYPFFEKWIEKEKRVGGARNPVSCAKLLRPGNLIM